MTERLHLHSLEKEMATTPVFLPGESQDGGTWWAAAYGAHRVGHNWSDLAAAAYTSTENREKKLSFLDLSFSGISNFRQPNILAQLSLKLIIQKTKIMASGPITSWQIDGETMETVADFIFWGS